MEGVSGRGSGHRVTVVIEEAASVVSEGARRAERLERKVRSNDRDVRGEDCHEAVERRAREQIERSRLSGFDRREPANPS
jgi:hypothetical protein